MPRPLASNVPLASPVLPAEPAAERPPLDRDVPEAGAAGTGFWLYGLHVWTVFGLALSNLFLGLTGVWALSRERRTEVPWHRMRAVLMPASLYAVCLAASIAFSVDPRRSLAQGGEVFSFGTLFLALLLVRGEAAVRRIVDGIVIIAAVMAAYGLGQLLVGYGDLNNRIRGPFSHYMTFAGVLLIADLLLIAQMVCGPAWRRAWRWAALLLINLALVGSLTRSAWVALVLTFTVLLLLRAPKFLLAYLPAGVLFFTLAPAGVVHRVVSIVDLKDISNYDRLCMAEAGLHMIGERPVLGLGPAMVKERYPIYRHPTAPRQEVPHLHNTFLQIGAEEGLLALGAYLWLMGGALVLAYRGYRAGGGQADLYMGVFLALLAFNLAGLFEHNWGDTEVQRMALFAVAMPYCLLNGAGAASGDRSG